MLLLSRAWSRGLVLSVALLAWFSVGGLGTAYANRFGPPWQSRVIVDSATLYTQADQGSTVVGPLSRGQLVVVVSETTAADGTAWTQTQSPDGWILSDQIAEETQPWVAEVTVASVSIYARPNTGEPIRRTARRGDLLRVTGASPGIGGDTRVWWSTTEGYVALNTLRESTSDWATGWTLPAADAAPGGWWGTFRSQINVRAAASTKAPIVGTLGPGDRVKVLSEVTGDAVNGNRTWYLIDGGRYAGAVVHSSLVTHMAPPKQVVVDRPADAPAGVGTIVVSQSASSLTYLDADNQPQFTTYVSLGRAGVETPQGEYSTMGKYRFDNMSSATVSNADHDYYLPNVPFVQYYLDGGYAIHSTYWHDQFGLMESQGCINLTWADGEYLFGLTQPTVADGDIARWAVGGLAATPVMIVQ
ncbi:MAG: SH3 domain-containing protein [Chloroflexi bacterium]|nr:SH3 domain-containing protein [Chloroflexota bacterium]